MWLWLCRWRQVFNAIRLPAIDSHEKRQAFRRTLSDTLSAMKSPLVFFPEVRSCWAVCWCLELCKPLSVGVFSHLCTRWGI